MRVVFVCMSGVYLSAKKLHRVKSSKMLFMFSPLRGRFCAFAQGWGAHISIVSVPCLPLRAGGRASTWFPRQSRGPVGGYILFVSIYPFIYPCLYKSIYLSNFYIYLSICLFFSLFLYLSIYIYVSLSTPIAATIGATTTTRDAATTTTTTTTPAAASNNNNIKSIIVAVNGRNEGERRGCRELALAARK